MVVLTYNPRSFDSGSGALGDRLTEKIDGVTTVFLLDLNTGLTKVLAEGTPAEYTLGHARIYLYGMGRIA